MSDETKSAGSEEAKVAAEKAKHPLLEFVPTVFESFDEWMLRWQGTTVLAEKLGLLHCCTEEGRQYCPEMVSFLLMVANHYDSEYRFTVESEHSYYGDNARNRRTIARKAFDVLCLKFFKGKTDGHQPLWWWMLQPKHEALFQKVLWFLQTDDYSNSSGYYRGITPRDHHGEIFQKFLQDFAKLGWEFESLANRYYDGEVGGEKTEKRMIATRPQFIEILRRLRILDWLNDKELDEASIKRLTELALEQNMYLPRQEVCVDNRRKPKTLAEAVLGGSVAAQVVVLHQIREKERKRINALYEASARERRRQNNQLELDRITEEKAFLERRAAELKGK